MKAFFLIAAALFFGLAELRASFMPLPTTTLGLIVHYLWYLVYLTIAWACVFKDVK